MKNINFNPGLVIILLLSMFICSCGSNHNFDASGSFEAEESVISSQAQGIILRFDVEEGNVLESGVTIGYVDSLQLSLKKEQLLAQIEVLRSKKPNIPTQLASLQQQLYSAEYEKIRITNLIQGDAATSKQLDDINSQIEVLKKQIEAQKSSLRISTMGIDKEVQSLFIQIKQLEDQIYKCRIINPINGTVLTKYARVNEMTSIGKPLYKIADLSNIILRVYITGNQLSQVKLDQKVTVHTDDGKGGFKTTEGTIIWISDKAEFTPKTIQTKDERANLVYALKIKIKNDGTYKIGMYGEITFD